MQDNTTQNGGKKMAVKALESVIDRLVVIRADENHVIEFSRMFRREKGTDVSTIMRSKETDESFHVHVDDGADFGSSFFFENIHEAHTFAKRMLAMCEAHGAGGES
jgi:hypothetical protein